MNPAGLLVDKYSYMVQPYNFSYFHHMDELGFPTDVVRKAVKAYPLMEPRAGFLIQYEFGGKQYLRREDVTGGFLVLHNDQNVFERYSRGAQRGSRFV